jgi:hypothetical protein
MNQMVIVNNSTQRRANVIYNRTKSMEMGVIKSLMIDTLKSKLRSGIAHFCYLKKDGSLREAWGTTAHNLIKANVNGNGIDPGQYQSASPNRKEQAQSGAKIIFHQFPHG